jgi:hypothetical protein
MTRKDFELIASVLRKNRPERCDDGWLQWEGLVTDFANRLAGTNPGFKRDRFIDACAK